jgi:hypothetical protein
MSGCLVGFAHWCSEISGSQAHLCNSSGIGGSQHTTKMLDGLERSKSPFSDHIHEITAAVSTEIMVMQRDHSRLFKQFETLGALGYLTITVTFDELARVVSGQKQPGWVSAPVGRAGWDAPTCDPILVDLERPEMQQELLKAGVGDGSKNHPWRAAEPGPRARANDHRSGSYRPRCGRASRSAPRPYTAPRRRAGKH